jgi:hypothetical protein
MLLVYDEALVDLVLLWGVGLIGVGRRRYHLFEKEE